MSSKKACNHFSGSVPQIVVEPEALPGGRWNENRLSFGIQARDALSLTYVFYEWEAPAHPGLQFEPLTFVSLDRQTFCFGNWWGFRMEFEPKRNSPQRLAYVILVEKEDRQKGWVLDPFTRNCTGGESWNKPVCFEIDSKTFSLHLMSRPQGPVFQGLRRLAIIKQEKLPLLTPVPPKKLKESIIYECHVRGMTIHPDSGVEDRAARGTFQALAEKIPHLQKLGVSVIELLPVFDFDENENPLSNPETGEPLLNYWGYSPLLFQVPKQSYALDVVNPENEFRQMVDAFHQAGIEVWLDVVFNHTAEMDDSGPTEHFKLLGREDWYLQDEQGELLNYSGCGNTFKCAYPGARRMIKDSLFYWAHNLGVDGFRFDLASVLERDAKGNFHDGPGIFWELKNDPGLSGIKLIVEPWDATGGYRLGIPSKSADCAEWNDVFRDSVRRAVRGDEGQMGLLKEVILGSPATFGSTEKGRECSINHITSHDGMTLHDLVSYNNKRNELNGEENRDGHNSEYSFNCGFEGPTEDEKIIEIRRRKIRLMHFLLQVSNGIPMLAAGDEMGRTQKGNNNAYCHDSPMTWIDWSLANKNVELVEFVCSLTCFRMNDFAFLFSSESEYRWYNALGEDENLDNFVRTLHWEVKNPKYPGQQYRFLLNCFERPVEFLIPPEFDWELHLDSFEDQQGRFIFEKPGSVWLEGFSAKALKA